MDRADSGSALLADALAALRRPAPTLPDLTPGEPPAGGPGRRGLRPSPPDTRQYGTLTIDQGQQMIRDAITTYLADPRPDHVLLIAAPAGIGKTTIAVEAAETFAAASGRVMYIGPRRDFFADLQPLMRQPGWWYNWQPRTLGKGQGVGQTCRYTYQIEQWMRRGYQGLDFCAAACGWQYIHSACPWHAQARRVEPIIFAQYEHLALGHPLMESAGLVIGDELPLRAFLHPWHIPAADIVPAKMPPSPRETLLRALRRLATVPPEGPWWSGPALLTALGGAAHVAEVCANVPLAELEPPPLRYADDAEQAPYGHLYELLRLLAREAEAAVQGEPYLERVRIDESGLTLLLRRTPRDLPAHIIWLDATASAPLYRELLRRPVRVVAPDVALKGTVRQVWASLNTKTEVGAAADGTAKLQHLQAQAKVIKRRGYTWPTQVTYKGAAGAFGDDSDTTHFHGSRGTNRLQGTDCLLVIGTPQPSVGDLVTTATMVYGERMRPFDTTWSAQDRPYAGQPWAYPVSGFWNDHDLQVLLEQLREAELIQALHRARPLRHAVDVWLLTNLPLPGIPVALVSLRELFGAPLGVDPYRWPDVVEQARARMDAAELVTSADLVAAGLCQPAAARRYLEALARAEGWHLTTAPASGRGKPPLACVRTLRAE